MAKSKKSPKTNPGKGYRFLKLNEILQAGDEFKIFGAFNKLWISTCKIGEKVGVSNVYRRKLPKPTVHNDTLDDFWPPQFKQFLTLFDKICKGGYESSFILALEKFVKDYNEKPWRSFQKTYYNKD